MFTYGTDSEQKEHLTQWVKDLFNTQRIITPNSNPHQITRKYLSCEHTSYITSLFIDKIKILNNHLSFVIMNY